MTTLARPTPSTRSNKLALRASVQKITPELAVEWLQTSAGNRRLSEARIQELALQMRAGEWRLNGESIKRDWHGRLIGGHHRLHACAKANVPFETVVVEGLNPRYVPTEGTGRPNSLADSLTVAGEKSVAMLAATLTRLVRHQALTEGRISVMEFANNTHFVPNHRAMAYLHRHPEVREAVRESERVRTVISPTRFAWLYCLARRSDPERAAFLLDKLATGTELKGDHPIYVLRARLIATLGDRKIRLKDAEYQALLIKGWNAFRAGRPCNARTLAWQSEPTARQAAEPFPTLVLS